VSFHEDFRKVGVGLLKLQNNLKYFVQNLKSKIEYFRIDATYEMRTTEYGEICISIDDQTNAERVFMRNRKMGKESKVMERQREIECVCASVDQNR
jgi:hypothetical protein